MAGFDHRGQVEHRPAVAARAVGREPVLMAVQAGEGAEVDHGASVSKGRLRARADAPTRRGTADIKSAARTSAANTYSRLHFCLVGSVYISANPN